MVAIVSGYSLGLNLTSLGTIGERGVLGNANLGRSSEQVYVNVATGNLVFRNIDDQLAGVGSMFGSTRVYNSLAGGAHAQAWSIGAALKKVRLEGPLNTAGSAIYRTDEDGSEESYHYDASKGLYVNLGAPSTRSSLAMEVSTGQYLWRDGKSGQTERYEGSGAGRILTSTDISGNTRSFAYGANGKLISVTDAGGGITFYDYAGENLAQIRTATREDGVEIIQTRVRYSYDALGRLSAVVVDLSPQDNSIADGKVFQTFYTYDGSSDRIATVSQSDGTQLSFQYTQVGGSYRVSHFTDALGRLTRYGYDPSRNSAYVVDPENVHTYVDYDDRGAITSVRTPGQGSAPDITTKYTYDASGKLATIVEPGERVLYLDYDANGNPGGWIDSNGMGMSRTFDSANRVLTETVYTQSQTSSASLGGPLVTRNAYDAAGHLRFQLSPAGNVTEYRYNARGERISTLTYAGDVHPLTGFDATNAPSEAQMVAWAAAANLKRVGRVDAVYDYRGMLQQTVAYAEVNDVGDGVLDDKQVLTRYVYDQAGRLLHTLSPTGGSTTYSYDGLGRVLSVQDAQGNVSLTQYDDVGNRVVLTQANGLKSISTYDKAGQRVSLVMQDAAGNNLGETRYAYDKNDRLIMTTDPGGGRTFMLYDTQGRKVGDVDAGGALKQYVYNGAGQVWRTITYMNTVDPDSLVDARGNPLNPSIDRLLPDSGGSTTVWNLYDGAGRLAKSIDEANALTEYRYDGVGRLVSETKYAQRMTAWNGILPSRPEHAVVTPSAGDATTHRFYTEDGKLRGTVDPEGAVVEYIYDGSGRQVHQIAYATRSTATVTAATSFENIRPVTADADIDEYSIYNNLGRLVGTIDAEGYLTERVYDASGNLTTRIRYATSLNGANNAVRMALAFTPDLVRVRPASSPQDSVWTYTYTRLNQVSSERDAEGTQTLYVYDEMGRLTSTVKAAGTPSSRSLLSRYDAQGHLTGELSGEGAAKLDGNQTQAEIDAIWKAYGTTYTYDAAGRRTSMTDGAGQRTLYYFDANGRVTHTINALGYVQERVYDNTGQLVETIRYGGPVWLEGLNGGLADGMLEWVLTAASDAEVDIHATYAYTQDRRLARETDGAGGVIEHHYDAFGNEIQRLTRIDGAINRTDRMAYDRLGRLTQSTDDALGYARKNTREYDAFGRVITTRDGAGNTVNHQYDRLGREVLTYDYLGEKSVAYDAIGNVLSSIDELGRRTSYAYDAQQRSVTVTTPDGVAVTTVHNAFGQTVEVRDGNGNVNRHVYNADGSLVRTEAGGTVTTQAYDCLNRLTETVDGRGVKTIYTYDAVGQRLSRTVDPEGLNLSTRYYYDAYGRQYHVVEPEGGQTAMTFDEAGRVLSLTVDAARLKLITRYTYDSAGQRLTVTAPNGVVTAYTYDSLGRRDSETVDPTGLALTTRYTYDLNDNLIARTDPDGGRTQYAFDSRGRVVFKVDPAGGVVETRYDAAGQISAEIAYAVPLGQAPGGGPYSEAQLRAMLVRHAADAVEYRYYDGNGRLAMTVGGAGNVVEMRYDGNGNLVERIAYANRLPMTRVGTIERPDAPPASPIYDQRQRMIYDALNRAVLQVDGLGGVVRQRFDANGNVLERVAYAGPIPLNTAMTEAAVEAALATVADPRQDRREANVYDRAGRLTHTMDGVGAVTRNIYDAAGNRVRQILYATPLDLGADPRNVRGSSGDRFSDWIYDGVGRLIASVDPTGAVTRRVLDANGNAVQVISHAMRIGADVPRTATAILAAVRYSPLDRVTTTAFDAVGRAVLVIDAEQGVVRNTYDAAGNLLEAYHFSMPLRGPDLASAAPASLTLAALTARLPPIDGQGRSSRGVYGANGRPTYKIDAAGFVTQFSYDARGNVTRVRRYAHGVSLAGAAPNVSEVQAALLVDEARDRVDRFAYDPQGRLLRATDSLGNLESYAYDGVGNKIRFINKAGDQWTYEYDAAGRLLVERSPQTNIVETRWSEAGDLTVGEAKRISVVTRNVYDGLGNLVSRTEADGQPQARTTRYGYDAAGRQIRTVFAPVKVYDAASDSLLTNGASGSAARREGAATSLTSDVLYNAFGEAVAGRDVAGAVSYKVYDKTGALKYDVDAEGYVTEYERNALGDVTQRLRYANKTTLADHGYGGISAEAVAAAVNAAGLDQGADRGVVTRYDRLGRAIETSQSQIFAYDSSAAAGSQYFTSNKLIRTEYDAFGQVSVVRELVNPVSRIWATTMQYYDKVGNMTGRVDALGYVTTMSYDGMGNKTSVREYATATTGWNAQGYGLPRAHADDRLTTYAYDVLGRKVAETRVNVEYSKQSNGTVQRGDLKTTFGYDALGNQTYVRDPAGGCTYSYYDALGRITATVEPRRTDALGMSFAPLTTFHRDALGNTVLTLQHANGATSAMASGYTAGA
ncbi:TPA: RHS repeat protein, partial [Pseudomonas aeruginosa]|nr:RHS repeat protein [Pseudomonas aeruginosa]